MQESLDETHSKDIQNKENQITQSKKEIESLKYEKTREEAKQDRIDKNKQEIKELIKKELEKKWKKLEMKLIYLSVDK